MRLARSSSAGSSRLVPTYIHCTHILRDICEEEVLSHTQVSLLVVNKSMSLSPDLLGNFLLYLRRCSTVILHVLCVNVAYFLNLVLRRITRLKQRDVFNKISTTTVQL